MLNPHLPAPFGGALRTQATEQPGQYGAQSSIRGGGVAVLTSPEKLLLALACKEEPNAKAGVNRALAPSAIPAVASLSVLDRTPGTLSEALGSLFPSSQVDSTLNRRVNEVLAGTGRQMYISRTSVLVREEYKPALEHYYRQQGIAQELVPLTQAAVDAENRCITEVTQNNIKGSLQCKPQTVFAIANAQYLKAEWAKSFEVGDTERVAFTTASGQVLRVNTMRQSFFCEGQMHFMQSPELQAVKLPFKSAASSGQQLSMLFVMKRDADLKQPCDNEVRQAIRMLGPNSASHVTEVALPQFRIQSKTDLLQTFEELGIGTALAQDQGCLPGAYLDEFTQECMMKIDEKGIEAAAVTLLYCNECARGYFPATVSLKFDRPFSAFVCLESTAAGTAGAIDFLFACQVNDPSAATA
ncbi:MAG: serpin family protein [Kistimonas sp.]|nr:serpin family protein [Kistimonas sp.]